jgi:hypothetical protein
VTNGEKRQAGADSAGWREQASGHEDPERLLHPVATFAVPIFAFFALFVVNGR